MYQAYIRPITNVRKHPNADRLMIGQVLGYTVVVGLDTKEGDIGIFFPSDGQLSEEYCTVNNLIGYIDENGIRQGGFFDSKRKVRAQSFRGVKSEGYFAPISSIAYTGYNPFDPDTSKITEFTTINGHLICQRYETEQTRKVALQNKGQSRNVDTVYFPKHKDTAQFLIELDHIPVGSTLYISEKLHGTSDRRGMVLVRQNLAWWKKAINKGIKIITGRDVFPEMKYEFLIGTRNTVLGDNKPDYYGGDRFRYDIPLGKKDIPRGMVVYGEIVGYTASGGLIMPEHHTAKTNDKQIKKLYSDTMRYTYGNKSGECSLYVYRITVHEKNGNVVELDHHSMTEYAQTMLSCTTVPLLHAPIIYDGHKESLVELVTSLADGPSTLDGSHIREGVVIRVEIPNGPIYFLKYKSFLFRVLEGLAKEDDSYVDTEETS